MSALTRGRALLQENRTLILGNSVATKPYPSSFSIPKKAQANAAELQAHRMSTLSNKTLIHPPSLTTSLIPSLNQISFERTFANESKSERKVYLPEDIDVSKLNFGTALRSKGNNKIIPVHYETDVKTLKLQTPPIRIPFGLNQSEYSQKGGVEGGPSYSMVFNLDNVDSDPEMKKFFDVMNAIDERMLKACEKHGKEWFDRDIPAAVLAHTFKKSVKTSKDPKYPPFFKVKVPVANDGTGFVPQINVFVDKKPAPITELVANSKIVGIVELRYLWSSAGTMVGSTWNLLQVKVLEKGIEKSSDRLSGYSFIERPPKN